MCDLSKDRRFMLFAGTTEGRELARFMLENGIPASIYTATEYGAEALRRAGVDDSLGSNRVVLRFGRLDEEAMRKEMSKLDPVAVIDATHPYAEEASRAIKKCCNDNSIFLIKVLRPQQSLPEGGIVTRTKNVADAAHYLGDKTGRILLTIGSRQLEAFCSSFLHKAGDNSREDMLDRLCVRILPISESFNICTRCGIKRRNIIAAEGPFSEDMNLSCIRHFHASFIVTKETGSEGGMFEKLSASKIAGIEAVTIMRPQDDAGINMEEAKNTILSLWDNI